MSNQMQSVPTKVRLKVTNRYDLAFFARVSDGRRAHVRMRVNVCQCICACLCLCVCMCVCIP